MRLVMALLLGACTGTIDSGAGSLNGNRPGGEDDHADAGTGLPGDKTPGSCANDRFGIDQIYCTKPGGDEWFINMDNPEENLARFDPKTELTRNMDGTWKVTDTQVRMNVFTK